MSAVEAKTIGESAEQAEVDLTLDNISIVPDSLCMACGGSGETRIMLTKIPLFREVLLSSFACPHCGERNTEVQFGGETQPKGCRMAVTCSSREDLDRQVVKSESCKVLVPDLELEIPAATQRGVVTTVEGVLTRAADELAALQPQRLVADVEVGRKVQRVIDALRDRAAGDFDEFQLIVDDPAGNSFVQPLSQPDSALTTTHYERTDADAIALGFRPGESSTSKTVEGVDDMLAKPSEEREVMTFGVDCPHCRAPGEEQMCVAKIPYFKECVIMSFSCAACGYRNAEVKGGGAVPLKGCRATLKCVDEGDLLRDVLKSDTAAVTIPELDLELVHGTLGSVYTTLEGCLDKIVDALLRGNPFGDSAETENRRKFEAFLDRVRALRDGKVFPFTVIMQDAVHTTCRGAHPTHSLIFAQAGSPRE
uniref:Zinc finger ZPR1-type domain-containing protein n=1 Tax=Pelagomonas calceolata TaxID=35677 RepID=A0A7S4EAK0_9STRA|mmetsp:Transcript_20166/g.62296  ORF Transcript_20166/g.62296 Transcript_20166/m.62296 type:complete len:423 (+) Transcript_20166:210-1478(+)